MIEFGISVLSLYGTLEIFVSHLEVLFIEAYVTSVEVVVRINIIIFYSFLVFFESSRHVTLVIESQTQILVIEREIFPGSLLFIVCNFFCFETNGLFVGA